MDVEDAGAKGAGVEAVGSAVEVGVPEPEGVTLGPVIAGEEDDEDKVGRE